MVSGLRFRGLGVWCLGFRGLGLRGPYKDDRIFRLTSGSPV